MEKFDEGDLKENVGIAEDLIISTRVFTNILTDFLRGLEVSVPSPSPAMYPACIQLSFIPPLVSSQLPCMSGSDDFINVVAVTGLHAWFEEFLFRSKFNEQLEAAADCLAVISDVFPGIVDHVMEWNLKQTELLTDLS